MTDLYHGEHPVDMTPAEALEYLANKSERALIVAWLRTYPPLIGLSQMAAWNVSCAVERGDHLASLTPDTDKENSRG